MVRIELKDRVSRIGLERCTQRLANRSGMDRRYGLNCFFQTLGLKGQGISGIRPQGTGFSKIRPQGSGFLFP